MSHHCWNNTTIYYKSCMLLAGHQCRILANLSRDQLKAKEEERVEIEEKYSSLQVSGNPGDVVRCSNI
jgi:hypothetical protein